MRLRGMLYCRLLRGGAVASVLVLVLVPACLRNMRRGFLSPRAAGLQVVLRSILKAETPNHLEWYFLRRAPCGRQTPYCTARSLCQRSIAAGGRRGLRAQAERRLTINAQLIHLNPEGLTGCLNLGSRSEHV